jgi:hypothetical protein
MTTLAWASSMRVCSASAENPPKTTECGRAESGAGQHRDDRLGDHRHVDGDAIARRHAELGEGVGGQPG